MEVSCASCGVALDESFLEDELKPCPSCGHGVRQVGISIHETIRLSEMTRLGVESMTRQPGERKFVVEETMKDDTYRLTGESRRVTILVDRANDLCRKTVVDKASGDVVFQKVEPLSEHTGRGGGARRETRCMTPTVSPTTLLGGVRYDHAI